MSDKTNDRCETGRVSDVSGRENKKEHLCTGETSSQQWEEESRGGNVDIRTKSQVYDGSQVQDSGNGGDVASLRNRGEEVVDNRQFYGYHCNGCDRSVKQKGYKQAYTHEQHLLDHWPNGVNEVDFIECKLCKFVSLNITAHVKNVHNLSKDDYKKLHGIVQCKQYFDSISGRNKVNGDWITRRKENGDDLSNYRKKMGESVSLAIMSNPTERLRRADLLGELNKRDDARKRSSDAAKITSACPEIQVARAKKLREWREREPEKFQACLEKMLSWKTSRPEKSALAFIQEQFPECDFKGNQQLKAEHYFLINKTRRRQLDIVSKKHKIIIEIDGHLHFDNVPQWNQLETIQRKDKELNEAAPKLGYTLIRISDDQWNSVGELSDECKTIVKEVILKAINSELEVVFVGKRYE